MESFQENQSSLACGFCKTLLYTKIALCHGCFCVSFPKFIRIAENLQRAASVIVPLLKFTEATNYILTFFFDLAKEYVYVDIFVKDFISK